MLTITLSVLGGPVLQETILQEKMLQGPMANGVTCYQGAATLSSGGKNYAIVHLWSYSKGDKVWHEVNLSNSSIENPALYFTGDYSMEIDFLGTKSSVSRKGAIFYDGTGYDEFFGRPQLSPMPGAVEFLMRNSPSNRDPMLAALSTYKPNPTVQGYPLTTEWSAANWSTESFDTAPNTHTTGTPAAAGDIPRVGAFLCLLSSGSDTARIEALTDNLFGWIGQQSRRPFWFFHEKNAAVWSALEYPSLIMGEYGPTILWNSKELWGRPKTVPAPKSPWNGWDREHLVFDNAVLGYLLFGSVRCLTQIVLLLENLLTQQDIKEVKVINSLRTWGWSLRALSWGLRCVPYNPLRIRYYKAIENLLEAYQKSAKYSPRMTVMDIPAQPGHIYPTYEQLVEYFGYKSWDIPVDHPEFVSKKAAYDSAVSSESTDLKKKNQDITKAHDALRTWLVGYVGNTYSTSEQIAILNLWSFVSPFQCAVAVFATSLLQDVVNFALPGLFTVRQHLLGCILLHGRNPSGTFWYDYGAVLPVTAGDGMNNTGVNLWVAGALGSLWGMVPAAKQAEALAAIGSVYNSNKYTKPTEPDFYEWFLCTARLIGYPK